MSFVTDQAERVDKPTKPYNHYSLLVYICNISCFTLLGFPLAFPFMLCGTAAAKSVSQSVGTGGRSGHWWEEWALVGRVGIGGQSEN